MANEPAKPRRDQLQAIFKTNDLVRKFEKLFEQGGTILPADVSDLFRLSEENLIGVEDARAQANKANALIEALNRRIQKVVTITSSYTALVGNYSIMADASAGNIIVTLPLASTARTFSIGVTKIDTSVNTVTMQRSGSDLIVGETSQVLEISGDVINVISDGSNWQLVN